MSLFLNSSKIKMCLYERLQTKIYQEKNPRTQYVSEKRMFCQISSVVTDYLEPAENNDLVFG